MLKNIIWYIWNNLQVMAPNNKGGLDIRDTGLINKALGAKILWKIATGEEAWCKDAVVRKYTNTDQSRMNHDKSEI